MNKVFATTLVCLLISSVGCNSQPQSAPRPPLSKEQKLAEAVWRANGGTSWGNVARLQFTFRVDQEGQRLLSAKHDWDLEKNTDTVTWEGKSITVDLANPGDTEVQKAAYQRWTNDSYWLLAPLKLRDPGVHLTYLGQKEIQGRSFEVLHLTFAQDLGLTPGDQYNLYIDPDTKLVRLWEYIPEPGKIIPATWEDYDSVAGLYMSTKHRMGNKTITFDQIKIRTEVETQWMRRTNATGGIGASNATGYTSRQRGQQTMPSQRSMPPQRRLGPG